MEDCPNVEGWPNMEDVVVEVIDEAAGCGWAGCPNMEEVAVGIEDETADCAGCPNIEVVAEGVEGDAIGCPNKFVELGNAVDVAILD